MPNGGAKDIVMMNITTHSLKSLFFTNVSVTSLCHAFPPGVFIITHTQFFSFFHAAQVFHKQTGTRYLKA